MLKRTFTYVQKTFPQVKNVFWYNSHNLKSNRIHPDNRGLLRLDYSRKPAFNTMKCYTQGVSC
jgi:hypothetical protein